MASLLRKVGLSQNDKTRIVNLMAAARVDGFIVLDGMLDHSLLKATRSLRSARSHHRRL